MAKKDDVGASTNLNNLNTMNVRLEGMGTDYAPDDELLSLANLQLKYTDGIALQKNYLRAKEEYATAVDEKQAIFEKAGKLLSPIINSMKRSKISSETIGRVKVLIDKYRGKVKSAKEEDKNTKEGGMTEEEKKERSNRQTSYAFLIQHFEGIYQILLLEPKYAPLNNDAIKLTSLATDLTTMRTKNTASEIALYNFDRLRNDQTKFHNDPETGIVALAALVKSTLIEDFTVNSTQYKAVSGLAFKKLYDSMAKKKKKKPDPDNSEGGE